MAVALLSPPPATAAELTAPQQPCLHNGSIYVCMRVYVLITRLQCGRLSVQLHGNEMTEQSIERQTAPLKCTTSVNSVVLATCGGLW